MTFSSRVATRWSVSRSHLFGLCVLTVFLSFGPLAFAQTAPPPGSKRISSVPTACPSVGITPFSGWVGAGPIYNTYFFNFTLVSPAIGSGSYKGPTQVMSLDATSIWNNPSGTADCTIDLYVWPPASSGYYFHFTLGSPMELGGRETKVLNVSDGGGGGGSCDYLLIADPSSTCTSGGGGGTGGDLPPDAFTPPPGGGSPPACTALQLQPGCYDVYINGVYDTTMCC